MRFYHAAWVEMQSDGMVRRAVCNIWVQLCRVGQHPTKRTALLGLPIHETAHRVQYNSGVYASWLHYTDSLCRVWQHCLLAAELTSLRPETPPLILADACSDIGEEHLAHCLRMWYSTGPGSYSLETHQPIYPELVGAPFSWPSDFLH